jgi:hypothetical protein
MLALAVISSALGCVASAQSAQKPAESSDAAIWNAVLAAGRSSTIPANIAASDDPEVEYTWWSAKAFQVGNAFWRECKEPDLERKLDYYVDQFGLHGADGDLIWMMGCPRFLIQGNYPIGGLNDSEKVPLYIGFRRVDDIICRREIERFAKEPAVLDRYYVALLWSGTYFGRGDGVFPGVSVRIAVKGDLAWVKKGLRDEPGKFWPRARSFVLLAHAMSRDDLISADKTKLAKDYITWCAFTSTDNFREHLRPDPTRPVWRYDPDFGCTEILWPYHAPTKLFPEAERSPRFLFDELYNDARLNADNTHSLMNSSLLQIGNADAGRAQDAK